MLKHYEYHTNTMTSYDNCCNYFSKKCLQWESTDPDYSMRKYIEKKQKIGLVTEFKSDPDFFETVCKFLKQYAKGQEKGTLTSIINDALDIAEGNLLPVHINLILAAVLEACGYSDLASNVLKGIAAAVIIGGILAAVGSLLKK